MKIIRPVTISSSGTFSRASTANYFDAAGHIQTTAINVVRVNYDPITHTAEGFLIEGAATNYVRNNTMQGAGVGTPGADPTHWVLQY